MYNTVSTTIGKGGGGGGGGDLYGSSQKYHKDEFFSSSIGGWSLLNRHIYWDKFITSDLGGQIACGGFFHKYCLRVGGYSGEKGLLKGGGLFKDLWYLWQICINCYVLFIYNIMKRQFIVEDNSDHNILRALVVACPGLMICKTSNDVLSSFYQRNLKALFIIFFKNDISISFKY